MTLILEGDEVTEYFKMRDELNILRCEIEKQKESIDLKITSEIATELVMDSIVDPIQDDRIKSLEEAFPHLYYKEVQLKNMLDTTSEQYTIIVSNNDTLKGI